MWPFCEGVVDNVGNLNHLKITQNVVRNIFVLNIYNLGTVNPTEVRRISK